MKLEEPCSPGHCLGMLNANMRTDMLRSVHEGITERKEQPHHKSPLEMLIESIEETLVSFEGGERVAAIGPNPFQTDPSGRFEPESDYHHDIVA